jgi:hypothetical protein
MITYGKQKKRTDIAKVKEFELLFKKVQEPFKENESKHNQLENELNIWSATTKNGKLKVSTDEQESTENEQNYTNPIDDIDGIDDPGSIDGIDSIDNPDNPDRIDGIDDPDSSKTLTLTLDTLLTLCNQKKPSNFTKYIKSLNIKQKIGEASYSDVYLSGNSAVKIIPILGHSQSTLKQAYQELKSTKQLQGIKGYVGLIDAKLVQGKYETNLVRVFDLYCLEKESENVHPQEYGKDQVYLCLVLDYCGVDLEHFLLEGEYLGTGQSTEDVENHDIGGSKNGGTKQDNDGVDGSKNGIGEAVGTKIKPEMLASTKYQPENVLEAIFIQVLTIISAAEEQIEFEHRDLHWGNIMIQQTTENHIGKVLAFGVKVTLIDFSLSRYVSGDVFFCDLEDDGLFNGKGDLQFDIYRWMRDEIISLGRTGDNLKDNQNGSESNQKGSESNQKRSEGEDEIYEDAISIGSDRVDWGLQCFKTNILVS